jgi:integrase/recombinase XerC
MRLAARELVTRAGRLMPHQLTAAHVAAAVQHWYRHGYAQQTRHQAHLALRRILTALRVAGAPDLTAHVTRVPAPTPRQTTVDTNDRELLLSTAPPYLRLFLLLISHLALRTGTAIRVAPLHFNPDAGELAIATKRGVHIRLPVTEPIRELFYLAARHVRPDCPTPFVSLLRGHSIQRGRILQLFHAHAEAHGLAHIRPHDLRRTQARAVHQLTGDLRVVQTLLGHANLNHTARYLGAPLTPTGELLARAAQVSEPQDTENQQEAPSVLKQ